MDRYQMLNALRERGGTWDIVVIGGGASGLGTAVDAASRGYRVALLEQSDFGKGTSSRSTKLVHGGVRYLRQGNVSLVTEALVERGRLLANAPHLVSNLAFIVPSYEWWESPFYGIGLKVYDHLAGEFGFGRSSHLSRNDVIAAIPSIQQEGLRGGTRYFDGQFDDARLAINLAMTAAEQGAVVANYVEVTGLVKDRDGTLAGVTARDAETGECFEVKSKAIVNATGPYADRVRKLDHPGVDPVVESSQGTHIVLDRSFLPCDAAIMVPRTDDGRVMFAIPWYDVAVVGTTDTPVNTVDLEPRPLDHEVDTILRTANRYLARPARRHDIKSAFAGIRPLVRNCSGGGTAALSRDHAVLIDPESGLLTVIGGKWTTYRSMAEDVVDKAARLGELETKPCVTVGLKIHGSCDGTEGLSHLARYGSDAGHIEAMMESDPGLGESVHPPLALTRAEVIWACRREMARTVDDVLSRRSRSLLFDARAAAEAARSVARVMAEELGREARWESDQAAIFRELADGYTVL